MARKRPLSVIQLSVLRAMLHRPNGSNCACLSYAGCDPATLPSLERRGLAWSADGRWFHLTKAGRRACLQVVR